MKIKRLLIIGIMIVCVLNLQAQTNIFHESFDAEQSKAETDVAWYEYINTIDGDMRAIWPIETYAGDGCMNFYNSDVEAEWWQRAIKFRNLPLQEGKSYRLTYYFKGQDTWSIDGKTQNKSKMSVALMQGGENADIPLLDANGNEFRYEVSDFSPMKYEKYTKMFYFASAQLQKDTYAEKNPDKEPLADTWFATFNIYNPGDYYLDEVDLSESPIAGVYFSSDVIRVDFGYDTNIKDLVNANPLGRVILPADCASVVLNDMAVNVQGVELQSDGYMYIFLDNVMSENQKEDKVEIAFNNPEDEAYQVKYKGTLAPEGAVPSFSGEVGEYLEGLDKIKSWAWTEPELVSTFPADGSFANDESIIEVSFTFDKPVMGHNEKVEPLVAKLNGDENLVLTTLLNGDEGKKTLSFCRRDRKNFPKGAYSVTLEGITSDKFVRTDKTFTLYFETGKLQLAETVYTDLFTHLLQGEANGIPEGWTCMVKGTAGDWTSGEVWKGGSACRNLILTGEDGNPYVSFYLDNSNGYTYLMYGNKEDARLTLPAGDIEFNLMALGHGAPVRTVEYRLEDMDGNVVLSTSGSTSVQAENFTTVEAAGTITAKFNNPKEQNFILKIHEADGAGTGARVLGFKARSFTMTEGESTEAEVVFADATYGGANQVTTADNAAPAIGSGWALYQADGNTNWKKVPGKDYNNSGTRIFKLGIKNLTAGYYTNGNWPLTYAVYGTGESESDNEPVLHLKSGLHQITYYASNWKENSDNAGKDHIVYFELGNKENGSVVYERNDKVVNCDMNNNRNANITAQIIQFTLNIPAEGDYTIKVGGSTEQFIGNFKIEKFDSQAAYNIGLVNAARALAIEELEASADEKYNGTTKTALQAAVDKYADLSNMHTPAEATAAKTELETLTKYMATRREYVTRYDDALVAAAAILEEVGEKEATDDDPGHPATKYAQLEAFTNLETVYNANSAKTAQELEDADLIAATNELENNTTWLKNMKDKCVGLLTKQIIDAAVTLVKLDANASTDEYVIAAGNALTDDQEIAKALQLRVTKAIYDKIANGDNPFVTQGQGLLAEDADSIDLSSFIYNRNLYTTTTDPNSRNLKDIKDLPGWSIDIVSGTPGLEVSWETWNASPYCPVNDQYLICGYNSEWNLYQTVKNLPVGKYTYVSSTQDRGFSDNCDEKKAYMAENQSWHVTGNINGEATEGDIFSYIWWQVGETKDRAGFNIENQGMYYDFSDCVSKQFNIPAAGEEQTGEVTIGSYAKEFQAQASADNFRLYMVGKDDTFDYAKAAKILSGESPTVIDEVSASEGEPASVVFYDLTGKQVSTPSGITIKVETYKNGYIKVSKIMAK